MAWKLSEWWDRHRVFIGSRTKGGMVVTTVTLGRLCDVHCDGGSGDGGLKDALCVRRKMVGEAEGPFPRMAP